jgi:hypothetical protein
MNHPNGIWPSIGFPRRIESGHHADQELDYPKSSKKLIILLIVSLCFSIAFSYMLSKQPVVLIRSDHYSRWYATYKLITEGRSLYDPQNGEEIVALNSIPVDPIEGSFFYPAYLIVFTLPLVWIPYPLAHFIWLILIQLFYILGIWLVSREIKWPNSINQISLFLFLSIVFIPNLQNTIWGQFNTIAVISLALVYIFLRRRRYTIAGLMTTGLIFKPQQMLLTLFFLLFWALYRRERWRYLFGFGIGFVSLYLTAVLFEPNWISSFIEGIRAYSDYLNPNSVLSLQGITGWVILVITAIFLLCLLLRNLASTPMSVSFAGCIILCLAIWWLFVPVLGMMHMVALPITMLLLFAGQEGKKFRQYKYGIWVFLILFVLGMVGFLYGLSAPELYGLHIQLSQIAYKLVAPILLVILAIPLGFSRKEELLV